MKFTIEDLHRALERHDDLADRGVQTGDMLVDHGFSDPESLSQMALDRALLGWAIATQQMNPRAGYQPRRVVLPITPEQHLLWATLGSMWMDGFTTALIMMRSKETERTSSRGD